MYPTLETERLIMRPWQTEDAVRMIDFAEVLNTTVPDNEMPPIRSFADAEWIVEDNIRDDNQWVIVYKPNNLMIGWLGIAGGKKIREKAVMWIWLDKEYWNKGICKEALEKAVHFAFYGLKTKCVFSASCHSMKNENVAACRALEHCGFVKYAVIPKDKPYDGGSRPQFRLKAADYHAEASVYDYVPPPLKLQSPYSFENPIRSIGSVSYIQQPTEYLCGQSVIAMLADVSVDEVIAVMQNDKGTSTAEIRDALKYYGLKTATKARLRYTEGTELPKCCILSVLLPGYGHWSLYYQGKYYDPEFGVSDKLLEQAKLRYYWEIV